MVNPLLYTALAAVSSWIGLLNICRSNPQNYFCNPEILPRAYHLPPPLVRNPALYTIALDAAFSLPSQYQPGETATIELQNVQAKFYVSPVIQTDEPNRFPTPSNITGHLTIAVPPTELDPNWLNILTFPPFILLLSSCLVVLVIEFLHRNLSTSTPQPVGQDLSSINLPVEGLLPQGLSRLPTVHFFTSPATNTPTVPKSAVPRLTPSSFSHTSTLPVTTCPSKLVYSGISHNSTAPAPVAHPPLVRSEIATVSTSPRSGNEEGKQWPFTISAVHSVSTAAIEAIPIIRSSKNPPMIETANQTDEIEDDDDASFDPSLVGSGIDMEPSVADQPGSPTSPNSERVNNWFIDEKGISKCVRGEFYIEKVLSPGKARKEAERERAILLIIQHLPHRDPNEYDNWSKNRRSQYVDDARRARLKNHITDNRLGELTEEEVKALHKQLRDQDEVQVNEKANGYIARWNELIRDEQKRNAPNGYVLVAYGKHECQLGPLDSTLLSQG